MVDLVRPTYQPPICQPNTYRPTRSSTGITTRVMPTALSPISGFGGGKCQLCRRYPIASRLVRQNRIVWLLLSMKYSRVVDPGTALRDYLAAYGETSFVQNRLARALLPFQHAILRREFCCIGIN